MAAAPPSEPAEKAPGKGGKLLRILGLVAACVLALVGGLVISVGPKRVMALISADPPPAAEEDHAGGSDEHTPEAGNNDRFVVTPFKEIIVNITATTAAGRQTTRFLKLNVALSYDATIAGAENIEPRKLFLRDSFQEYLRQLDESDLQGSIGLVRLRGELLRRARAVSESDAPQQLLIADLIIQ